MRTNIAVWLALVWSFNVQAYSNFIENPYTPYPPGCVSMPVPALGLIGDNVVKFYDGKIWLANSRYGREEVEADLRMYRVACPEPNRSVIWLELAISSTADPGELYNVPYGWAWNNTHLADITLTSPNGSVDNWAGWGHDVGWRVLNADPPDWIEGPVKKWYFVLNNLNHWIYGSSYTPGYFSAKEYNEGFGLGLNWDHEYQVPSTASLFSQHPQLPLSGRLSGNWVIDGAADQGLALNISEPAPDAVPEPGELSTTTLLMFLSWYTYDSDGQMLWLTAAEQFDQGANEVTLAVEYVRNGEFMSGKRAERSVVGSVSITANSCNDLRLDYDLSQIGLGAGSKRLQRLYSLETAGYVCRDLDARMLTNQQGDK